MRAKTILIPLLCLAAGGAAGFAAGWRLRPPGPAANVPRGPVTETREGGQRFVNPLLECELGRELLEDDELTPFRARVEAHVREWQRRPGVERISLYFRALNDGVWFSIGDTERFTPASLRKVPMMIAVLKQAERSPELLQRQVPFRLSQDHNAGQTFKPSATLVPGQAYPVAELVRRMIVYSDNNAFMLLGATVDPEELDRTYAKLDLRGPQAAGEGYLSAQTYASFFRVLFNAGYLGKRMSEWALSTLAESEFRSGIVAGVPASVPVAHKFGEHRDDDAGRVQLHDCGIVYAPERPYLLCVMTRGTSFEPLDGAIASIARVVHAEVTAAARPRP